VYTPSGAVEATEATISGTSVSFSGGSVSITASAVFAQQIIYNSFAQRLVIFFIDGSDLKGMVYNAGGGFGAIATGFSSASGVVAAGYDVAAQKFIVSAVYASAYVGLISATASGSTVTFSGASPSGSINNPVSGLSFAYDATLGKLVAAYNGASSAYYATSFTFSGGNVNVGTTITVSGFAVGGTPVIAYAANAAKTVGFRQTSASDTGAYFLPGIVPNLTANNFIGFSKAAYANGATATVQTVGSYNSGQSGLTAGTKYYVATDGTLSTSVGTLSVYAGVALSATSILVKG
jgi:hypothetical protein